MKFIRPYFNLQPPQF